MANPGRKRRAREARVEPQDVHSFVERLIGDDLHAKRVLSLSHGVVGVLHATALSIHAIGQGLALANGTDPRHGVKQIDRLLSNAGVDLWELFEPWVLYVIGQRKELVVALDWTEFDGDDQSTIAANLVTSHGRATPLVWKSAKKSTVTDGERNDLEDELLLRLQEVIPKDVKVTIVADRGFGDTKLYEFLEREGWDYVIRFRGNIGVTSAKGETKKAKQWLQPSGRARTMRGVGVTDRQCPVPAFVSVHAKNMKDAWFLATSRSDLSASEVVKLYGKRFSIEETFRDLKDPRYGFGLSKTRIRSPMRRDRLIFLFAMAHALLTLLGAASERTGLDRKLKVNTVKKRTHSLFRQGAYWFSAIPAMPDARLQMLMEAFSDIVAEHAVFRETFGVI